MNRSTHWSNRRLGLVIAAFMIALVAATMLYRKFGGHPDGGRALPVAAPRP